MNWNIWACPRCGTWWPNDMDDCPDCEAYRKPRSNLEFDDED